MKHGILGQKIIQRFDVTGDNNLMPRFNWTFGHGEPLTIGH
jgi:hypothetical protein